MAKAEMTVSDPDSSSDTLVGGSEHQVKDEHNTFIYIQNDEHQQVIPLQQLRGRRQAMATLSEAVTSWKHVIMASVALLLLVVGAQYCWRALSSCLN